MNANKFDYSTATEKSNLETVQNMYDVVFNGRDVEAADLFLDRDFVQHNRIFGDGVGGFEKAVSRFLELIPDLEVTTQIAVAQNDRVFFYLGWRGHSALTGEELVMDVADVYRVTDGKLTEHWDKYDYSRLAALGFERPDQDQPTVPIDRTGTLQQRLNLALTLSYLSDVTIQDTSRAGLYVTEDFTQYDLSIGQGLAGYKQCFEGFQSLTPDAAITVDNLVVGTGHVGAILTTKGRASQGDGEEFLLPTADVYRLENDMLSEHWGLVDFTDVIALLGFNPKEMLG